MLSKERSIKFLDHAIPAALTVQVVSPQVSIAVSSIAEGALIIFIGIRLLLDRNVYKPDKKLFLFFGLFIFSEILSTIFSYNQLESLDNMRKLLLITTFFASFVFIKNFSQLKVILYVFFIFTALVSAYEIFLFFRELDLRHYPTILNARIGYFTHHLTAGEIKLFVIMLMFSFLICKKEKVFNFFILFLLFFMVLASLYFTHSRTVLLTALIGIFLIPLLYRKEILIILAVIFAAYLTIPHPAYREVLVSALNINDASMNERYRMWETGIRIIKDNPIVGIGDTDLRDIYPKYTKPESDAELMHMHNNFLQILCNFGIIGFISWSAMMIYIFIRQIKIFILTKDNFLLNTIAVASLVSMVVFQLSGLTEWSFGDHEVITVGWFCFGLAFLAEKLYKEQKSAEA